MADDRIEFRLTPQESFALKLLSEKSTMKECFHRMLLLMLENKIPITESVLKTVTQTWKQAREEYNNASDFQKSLMDDKIAELRQEVRTWHLRLNKHQTALKGLKRDKKMQ